MSCSWLVHDLFCSWPAHDLFMTDLFKFLMTCPWLVYDLLLSCSWLAHDLFTTYTWLVHDLLLAHDLYINFSFFLYDLFLKPVMETHCLFLRPITETHCLFFSTLYSDNFIKISWFRGEGAKNEIFTLSIVFRKGIYFIYRKFYQCGRVPLISFLIGAVILWET